MTSSPVRASLPPPALKRCGQSARGLAGARRAASALAPGPRPPVAAIPWLRVRRGLAGAGCPLVLVRRLRLRASHGSAGVAARAPSRSAAPLCGDKGLASPRAPHSSVPPLTGRNLRPLRCQPPLSRPAWRRTTPPQAMSAGGLLSGGGRVLAVPARPRLFPRPRPPALWPSQFAFVVVPAPLTRRLFLLLSWSLRRCRGASFCFCRGSCAADAAPLFAFVVVPAPLSRRLFLLFSGGKKGNNHERTFVAVEDEEWTLAAPPCGVVASNAVYGRAMRARRGEMRRAAPRRCSWVG